jgi:hypothetical protein
MEARTNAPRKAESSVEINEFLGINRGKNHQNIVAGEFRDLCNMNIYPDRIESRKPMKYDKKNLYSLDSVTPSAVVVPIAMHQFEYHGYIVTVCIDSDRNLVYTFKSISDPDVTHDYELDYSDFDITHAVNQMNISLLANKDIAEFYNYGDCVYFSRAMKYGKISLAHPLVTDYFGLINSEELNPSVGKTSGFYYFDNTTALWGGTYSYFIRFIRKENGNSCATSGLVSIGNVVVSLPVGMSSAVVFLRVLVNRMSVLGGNVDLSTYTDIELWRSTSGNGIESAHLITSRVRTPEQGMISENEASYGWAEAYDYTDSISDQDRVDPLPSSTLVPAIIAEPMGITQEFQLLTVPTYAVTNPSTPALRLGIYQYGVEFVRKVDDIVVESSSVIRNLSLLSNTNYSSFTVDVTVNLKPYSSSWTHIRIWRSRNTDFQSSVQTESVLGSAGELYLVHEFQTSVRSDVQAYPHNEAEYIAGYPYYVTVTDSKSDSAITAASMQIKTGDDLDLFPLSNCGLPTDVKKICVCNNRVAVASGNSVYVAYGSLGSPYQHLFRPIIDELKIEGHSITGLYSINSDLVISQPTKINVLRECNVENSVQAVSNGIGIPCSVLSRATSHMGLVAVNADGKIRSLDSSYQWNENIGSVTFSDGILDRTKAALEYCLENQTNESNSLPYSIQFFNENLYFYDPLTNVSNHFSAENKRALVCCDANSEDCEGDTPYDLASATIVWVLNSVNRKGWSRYAYPIASNAVVCFYKTKYSSEFRLNASGIEFIIESENSVSRTNVLSDLISPLSYTTALNSNNLKYAVPVAEVIDRIKSGMILHRITSDSGICELEYITVRHILDSDGSHRMQCRSITNPDNISKPLLYSLFKSPNYVPVSGVTAIDVNLLNHSNSICNPLIRNDSDTENIRVISSSFYVRLSVSALFLSINKITFDIQAQDYAANQLVDYSDIPILEVSGEGLVLWLTNLDSFFDMSGNAPITELILPV